MGRFHQDCGQRTATVRLHPKGLARDLFFALAAYFPIATALDRHQRT